MLAAGCPCGISRSSLHPAAQRTHRSLLQRERPARTPWWRPPGDLCAATPLGRHGKPSGHLWTHQRDAGGRWRPWAAGQWWPRARGAEPQSFGSKRRWSEGGGTTWTTRQLCLSGSREAGREVSCRVGFYKVSAETVPRSRCVEHPQRAGVYVTPLDQGLFRYQNQNQNSTGEEMRWGVTPTVPAVPVRPAPYSFSSLISTMSVLSSAAGMSVMAESSPSTADSFSIFFFCFR